MIRKFWKKKANRTKVLVSTLVLFQVLGILSAIHSIMSVRTPQGSIAWALGLDTGRYESPFEGGQKFSIAGKDTGEKGQPITAIFS